MPGQRQPLGRRQPGHAPRLVDDRLGRVPVRADLERVLAFDLEEVADLGEDARYGEIVHVITSRRHHDSRGDELRSRR